MRLRCFCERQNCFYAVFKHDLINCCNKREACIAGDDVNRITHGNAAIIVNFCQRAF